MAYNGFDKYSMEDLSNEESGVARRLRAEPLLPPVEQPVPELTVRPPSTTSNSSAGPSSSTISPRTSWKPWKNESKSNRASPITTPPPTYRNHPLNQQQSQASEAEPSHLRRHDNRKWYNKKRTFLFITVILIIILVVTLVTNLMLIKDNQGPGNWPGGPRRGRNGTDAPNDFFLSNAQTAAFQGVNNILVGDWKIGAPQLAKQDDADMFGPNPDSSRPTPLDTCAASPDVFTPCTASKFLTGTSLSFNINQTSPGVFIGTFAPGVFDVKEAVMDLRPFFNGFTTIYQYKAGVAGKKKNNCLYGHGMQLYMQLGSDGSRGQYKLVETQMVSGDGCAQDGGQTDRCTCVYSGAR